MCLVTFNIEGEIAKAPVTCYKVYKKGEGGAMEAYYTGVKYELKEGDMVIAEGEEEIERDYTFLAVHEMGRGFIHALFEEAHLLRVGSEVWSLYCSILRILRRKSNIGLDKSLDGLLGLLDGLYWCEMEIPAGTRHWIGNKGDVCAKRMVFKKDITPRKKSELIEVMFREACSINSDPEVIKGLESLIETYKNKGE